MNIRLKTTLSVSAALFLAFGLTTARGQQQNNNNNRQQRDPNAPKGTITGQVIGLDNGSPIKKVTVTLTEVQNNVQQPQQPQNTGTQAGGLTATSITNLGQSLGTTAAGTTGQGQRGTPTQVGGNLQTSNNFNLANVTPGQNQNANQNGGGQGGNANFRGGSLSATTGTDGVFTFNDVPAGDYMVSAQINQYLSQEYGQRSISGKGTPVSLQPGARLDSIDFKLTKAGVISGTLVDEEGYPLPGAQVQAFTYNYQNGQRTLKPVGSARTTDDIGEYRLFYLEPGEYYILAKPNNNPASAARGRGPDIRGIIDSLGVDPQTLFAAVRGGNGADQGNPGNQGNQGQRGRGGRGGTADIIATLTSNASALPAQDMQALVQALQAGQLPDPKEAYSPAYYPGVADAAQAAVVRLVAGSDARGIDFGVKSAPTVTISGTIIQPTGILVPRNQQQQQQQQQQNNNNRGTNTAANNTAANTNNRGTTATAATTTNNNNRGTTAAAATTNNNNRGTTAAANNNTTNNNNRGNTNNTTNNNANNANNRGGNNNANNANNGNNRGNGNTNNVNLNNRNNNAVPLIRPTLLLVPIGISGAGRGGGGNANNNAAGRGGRGGGTGGGFPGGGGNGTDAITGRTTINNDGTFQLTGVIPGSYNLVAIGDRDGVQVTAMQRVDVTNGVNVTGVPLALRQGTKMLGQIYPDVGKPDNFNMANVRVQLQLADDLPGVGNGQEGRANADGLFTLEDLIPGAHYRVRVQNVQGGYLMAGVYGSEEALSAPILVENEGTALKLQVGFNPAKIDVVVSDRDKPVQGMVTVLVPKNRARSDYYKNATSGAEGKVSFSNLPPGDYKLFAWEEVIRDAWQDPQYMEKFEDKGRLIHLEKGGTATETIQVIKSGTE